MCIRDRAFEGKRVLVDNEDADRPGPETNERGFRDSPVGEGRGELLTSPGHVARVAIHDGLEVREARKHPSGVAGRVVERQVEDRPARVRTGEEPLDRRLRQLGPYLEAHGLSHVARDSESERRGERGPGPARVRPLEQGGGTRGGEEAETDLGHHAEARERPDAREDERKDDLQDGDDGARGAERARDTEPGEERARCLLYTSDAADD